jgi:hypothetical protein
MKSQGWTPKIMFQKADEFFISLGLEPMPDVSLNEKLPPHTLVGFDLTTRGSNLLGGRRRRYHYTTQRVTFPKVF